MKTKPRERRPLTGRCIECGNASTYRVNVAGKADGTERCSPCHERAVARECRLFNALPQIRQ